MSKKFVITAFLLGILAFLIPIEHKYDKLFRFYSLTLIPEGLEVSKQYDKKIYFYISDIIAIALTFIGFLWFRIEPRKWFRNPLWIVWICAFFSILFSPFFHYPIPYFRLIQLFTPIALFSFLINVEKDFTKVILHGIVLAGLIQTAIATAQYFNQAPLGLRILGELSQPAVFTIPDGSRWLLDQLLGRSTETTILIRAAGTFPHANVFGGFMMFSILATYYLGSLKKIWLLTLPFQFFSMVISYSRAALFAWALTTFAWLCIKMYQSGLKKQWLLICILTLTFGATSLLLFKQYFHRGGVLNYNSWVKNSDHVRKVQHETGARIVYDNLLFGLGYTQFSERAIPYFEKNTQKYIRETAPHNIFLFLACETGLISLSAFCLFLGLAFWKFFQSPITEESALFVSLLGGFIFIGFCDFYPILFQHGKLMFFLIAALLYRSCLQNRGYTPSCSKAPI